MNCERALEEVQKIRAEFAEQSTFPDDILGRMFKRIHDASDAAIAALTDEQPQKVEEVPEKTCQQAFEDEIEQTHYNWVIWQSAWHSALRYGRRLAEHTPEPNRAVVSRKAVEEKIQDVFDSMSEFPIGEVIVTPFVDAVFALQLTAPQPITEIDIPTIEDCLSFLTKLGMKDEAENGDAVRLHYILKKHFQEAKHGQ